jgi:porin
LYLGSGQPGNQAGAVWYNWPVSQWGGRVKVQDGVRRYLQLGVFDQNPENLDPDQALDLYRHGSEGVITPVEVGWVPDKGPGGLPGKYKLGAYYSSAEATDYEGGGTRGRRYGGYFVVQQQVSAPHGDRRGLTLFSQGSWHDPDTAYVARYLSAGASWRGPWQGRPRDELGVGLAYAEIGDAYVDSATAGNPLVAGPGAAGYVPPQSDEWNAELYYGIHMTPWLTLRPNLQYLVHPGANDAVDDAWVVGTTVALTL